MRTARSWTSAGYDGRAALFLSDTAPQSQRKEQSPTPGRFTEQPGNSWAGTGAKLCAGVIRPKANHPGQLASNVHRRTPWLGSNRPNCRPGKWLATTGVLVPFQFPGV